jgi:hypothetical protein
MVSHRKCFKLSTATRFGASSLTSVSERGDDDATIRGTGRIGERDADAPPWRVIEDKGYTNEDTSLNLFRPHHRRAVLHCKRFAYDAIT